jgi:hypothetical protein
VAFDAGTIETKLDIDRAPFKEGLIAARREADEFEKRKIKVRLELDKSAIGQLEREIGRATGGTRKGVRVPVEVDQRDVDEVKKKLDDIGDNTELTAKRSGSKFGRALLNPLVVQLGLLPGIALAASAAGALALGALPLAIGAVGIAALKSNEQIKLSYAQMWGDIKQEATAIAQPLVQVFDDTAHQIFGTWRQLRPELKQMFADSAPLISDFVDGVLGAAEEAVPHFQRALQVSGPAMRGFASLIKDVGGGLGEMAEEASKSSVAIGTSTRITGQILRTLLRDVGTLVGQFAGFWADIGPRFEQTFNKLMDAVLRFTDGGLRGMGNTINITLTLLNALLSAVGPVADIFGQIGGTVLGLIGSWKLFAGVIGLVGKAWGLLKPSEWLGKLSGVSTAITNMGNTMGGWVTKVSGSEEAGKRFSGTMTKIGDVTTKAASALPLIGAAIIGVQAAVDHFWPSADDLASKIMEGGAAAEEARGKMIDYGNSVNTNSLWATAFAASSDEVNAAIKKQREGMTELERAQQDASRAQRDYNYAVDKYGENSSQAIQAQENLSNATDDVEEAQHKAALATQDHTDKIIAQTNIMLGAVGARLNYQSSLLSLEEAQRSLTTAVKEHGVGSLEARQADIAYQQGLLQVINGLGARVKAENASKSETEQNTLATAAMHQEIARLAVAAGTDLPPALAEMASVLSDTELKQLGVTREIDNTGQAIYRLPPGKNLAFPNDAPIATSQVNNLATAIYNLPTQKWFHYYIDYITTGKPPPNTSGPAGSGGLLGPASGGRAKGGPVKAGRAYWTGEEGIPELFFPDVDGFVLNGRDSARIADAVRRGGTPATPANFTGDDGSAQDGGMSADWLVSSMVEALRRMFDGARMEVDGSGLAKLVNRTNTGNRAR